MKKLLIVIPHFCSGGTLSSLESLLSVYDKNRWQIDVFALHQYGQGRSRLNNCTILQENLWLSSIVENGNWLQKIASFVLRCVRATCRIFGFNVYKYWGPRGGKQIGTGCYDAILAFQESLTPIVCYYPAKKRIIWIRCEYNRYCSDNRELKYFEYFDSIVCVSEFTKQSVLDVIPEVANKLIVINNCLDVDGIRNSVSSNIKLDDVFNNACFTIISVGRLDPVKQFETIPLISDQIRKNTQIQFKWVIIGNSTGFESVKQAIIDRINKLHLENVVQLLDETNLIYNYISRADLLVQTSKSETFSRVVHEAKVLGVVPILNTYGCSAEFVRSGYDGIITPIENMGETIAELINKPSVLSGIRKNLLEDSYNNNFLISQIDKLI